MESDDLIAGTMPFLYKNYMQWKMDNFTRVPGGLLRFQGSPDVGYRVVEDLIHNGSERKGVSTAVPWGGGRIILGGPFASGIGVCVAPREEKNSIFSLLSSLLFS
mmetsp:Transcript_17022/g.27181  ORF Transcript_17022/g.27181 Transcript_17022/m.27181 type:complete len:105 (-) Transcript_17022:262-576(-)